MSYHHLTTFERAKIGILLEYGFTQKSIAEQLGRANCGRTGKYSEKLAELINEKLRLTWSPEQIVGCLFQGVLSFRPSTVGFIKDY